MALALVGFFVLLNLFLSYWNARAAGSVWTTTKIVGGYQRFMAWMVVIMSAAGFTWCYTVVIGFVAYKTHHLNAQSTELLFNLSYVVLIPAILFSGYAITFDSWKRRIQTGRGTGVALWNTGAMAYNTVNAARGIDKAVKSTIDGLRKNPQALLVVGIFIVAFFGGILTTYGLVKHYAKSDRLVPVERTPRTPVQDAGYGDYGFRRYDR